MSETPSFAGWAIVELMGHRRLAGLVSEQEVAGAAFLRLDMPADDNAAGATQLYSAAAIYCITPTTEEIARAVLRTSRPQPVQRWELAAPPTPREYESAQVLDDEEIEDDQPDFSAAPEVPPVLPDDPHYREPPF